MVKSFKMSTSCHISIKDVEIHEEGEDVFFDSFDFLDTSFDPEVSTTSYLVEKPECELRKFSLEFWGEEMSTVHERRNRFLRETGFDKLVLPQLTCMEEPEGFRHNVPLEKMELEMMSNSLSSHDHRGGDGDSTSSAEVLDAKQNLLDHNLGQNGATGSRLNDLGSNRTVVAWQESEIPVGPHYVQPLLDGANGDSVLPENKRLRRWWRSLTSKRNAGGMLKNDSLSGTPDLPKALVKKVIHENSIEMTEFRMAQEVTAHKGLIKTMKFSPCGMHLATGGEDGVIRVWKVRQVESSSKCLISTYKTEKVKLRTKNFNCAYSVSPDEVLRLEEVPLHEYFGHTSDILDLSWSISDYLLSASKDKTVRMWKVGCDSCVKVFHHNDCVTCIQFNPADDRYLISGSLDGKVRIWGVHENRVVNWVDTRNIITAISYQTDGKSFAVGTLSGNCRFYVYLGNNLQLDRELRLRGKKRLSGNQITSLQFCPGDSKKIMITSLDSKVWIFDGSAITQKFGGSWKSKRHVAASFTADGRHLVSVGQNSNICIRDYNNSGIASGKKGAKLVFPCEQFFSEGVTVAVPWPSVKKREADSPAHSPTPSERNPESTFVMSQHQNILSLSSCFGAPRVSATWPEEKLPATPMFSEGRESESPVVIVTGSCSGTIRLLRYSRIPMKLC